MFGVLGVKVADTNQRKPVLRLVKRRSRGELIPLITQHVRRGSTILNDELCAYWQALPQLGYGHYTVSHSVSYVDAQTVAHTQRIERAWKTYKETVWRLRGNRTEELLKNHLTVIEWYEWLAKKHHNGPLGQLNHDLGKLHE